MLTSKESRTRIENAMREIFPKILPSRLQEARQAILTHLGMTANDFGFHPSGKLKFDSYCSQAVKGFKSTGEMSTQGWVWHWNGAMETSQPTTPVVNMEVAIQDIFDVEFEVESQPSLYDLDCEETLIRLIAITPCFGAAMQTDTMCQGCPLFDLCLEKKGEVKQAKKEAREAKKEALEIAYEKGYDLSKVKVPKSARVREIISVTTKSTTNCVVSGESIPKGTSAYHIPSWGMVKKVIGDSYIALNEI